MKLTLRLAPAFALAALLGTLNASYGQAPAQEVFVPQTRGPIHEAFLQPIEVAPEPSLPVPKAPPSAINELPPDEQPQGKNVQWVPGYWAWDADAGEFLWVSGLWRDAPPGRQYVPGYWTQTPEGWRWVAGFWAPTQNDAVTVVPPPPAPLSVEPNIPAPDDNSTFVPGVWVYQNATFAWRPGYWTAFRPGLVWVPAHYVWTPAGFVFVDGYWDLPLESRGLLFAPVVFTGTPWIDTAWCYRPSYVVNFGAIFDACFYRRGHAHFYFGDYYGAGYVTLGFRPWYTAFGRYDPAFSYYAWQQRGTPNWFANYQSAYVARANGTVARPPRTFAQQSLALKQAATPGGTVTNAVSNVRVVTPLGQFAQQSKNVTIVRAAGSPTVAIQRSQALVQGRQQLDVAAAKAPPKTVHSLQLPATAKIAGTSVPSLGSSATLPATGGNHVLPKSVVPSPLPVAAQPKVTTPTTPLKTTMPAPSATAPRYTPPVTTTTPKSTPRAVTAPKFTPSVKAAPSALSLPSASKHTPAPVMTTPKSMSNPAVHVAAPVSAAPKAVAPAYYTPAKSPVAAPKAAAHTAHAVPAVHPPRVTAPLSNHTPPAAKSAPAKGSSHHP